jgi:hypothetical protein
MNVPDCAMPVLSMFRSVLSTPTYHRLCVLMLAAVLTTGRHIITNLIRTVPYQAHGRIVISSGVFSASVVGVGTGLRTDHVPARPSGPARASAFGG